MILLTDIKGNKRKTDVKSVKNNSSDSLPGVYFKIQDKGVGVIQWKKLRKQ